MDVPPFKTSKIDQTDGEGKWGRLIPYGDERHSYLLNSTIVVQQKNTRPREVDVVNSLYGLLHKHRGDGGTL